MTGRYLAVVATGPDRAISPRVREAIATDPRSSVVFDAGGLTIAATETLACLRLSGERGMILGPIHRGGVSENGDVAQELARLFAGEARPELLTQSFWGDYVAFLSDPQSGAWQVLRAPFGRLACLHARSSASVLVGSDVAGLRSAGLSIPTVDREALVTRLAYADHPSSSTCLSGIAALRGGRALHLTRDHMAERDVWSPWPFARRQSALANEHDAESHVRSAVLRAVRACRSDAGDPLLLLSGGLDSSVLAASLAALGGGFVCVNFVRDGGAGDERLFARAVADRVGATLIEAEWRLADVDVTRCHLPGVPDPIARSFMQGTNSLLVGASSATGADVTIDGGGGDNVFFGLRSVAPVTDALLRGETLAAGWKTAASVARLAQTSVTRVFAKAVLRSLRASPRYRMRPNLELLSADASACAPLLPPHPWMAPPPRARAGAAAHVALVAAAQGWAEASDLVSPVRHAAPLATQPVVEACLQVPSWWWFEGEHNRAIARNAFADRLPRMVIERQSKGSPDGYLAAIYTANLATLRAMLLDGRLRDLGLIDARAIDAATRHPGFPRDVGFHRILRLADVEAWLAAQG